MKPGRERWLGAIVDYLTPVPDIDDDAVRKAVAYADERMQL